MMNRLPLAIRRAVLATVPVAVLVAATMSAGAEGDARVVPSPAFDTIKSAGPVQTIVLAGGCFWGMQGVFEHVHGVRKVISGYAGGSSATANYLTVGSGVTGHAESVQIAFDPQAVTVGELLRVYFSVAHDPTQLNRQGNDQGTQYRSDIFAADEGQQKIAEAYIDQLTKAGVFRDRIVTRVDRLTAFYPAEDYHQDYLIHHPTSGYIVHFDLPKIANLQRLFPEIYEAKPATVHSGDAS